MSGIICFSLTIRLAYASLAKKLEAREKVKETKKIVTIDVNSHVVPPLPSPVHKTIGVLNAFNSSIDTKSRQRALTLDSSTQEVILFEILKYFCNDQLCFFFLLE